MITYNGGGDISCYGHKELSDEEFNRRMRNVTWNSEDMTHLPKSLCDTRPYLSD